jgi:hypothetical protein
VGEVVGRKGWEGKATSSQDGPLRLSTSERGFHRSAQVHCGISTQRMASRSLGQRLRSQAVVTPAVARLKGMTEMLDIVDFGVATCEGDKLLRSQGLKYPTHLAIQRSAIKTDGGRKRWQCNKACPTIPDLAWSRLGTTSALSSRVDMVRTLSAEAESETHDPSLRFAKRSR